MRDWIGRWHLLRIVLIWQDKCHLCKLQTTMKKFDPDKTWKKVE